MAKESFYCHAENRTKDLSITSLQFPFILIINYLTFNKVDHHTQCIFTHSSCILANSP